MTLDRLVFVSGGVLLDRSGDGLRQDVPAVDAICRADQEDQ